MSDVQEILRLRSRAYDPAADTGLIERSFAFAAERHAGQKRRSGDPVRHPSGRRRPHHRRAALDVPSVCAGLLHDCVEDTSATAERDRRAVRQGDRVPRRRRHQARQDPVDSTREERRPRTSARCCSRWRATSASSSSSSPTALDNMRTLEHMPPEKQERIARETMRDLRAARQPPRHPVDQGRARGPRVQVPRARASTTQLVERDREDARGARTKYIDEVAEAHPEASWPSSGVAVRGHRPRQAPVLDLPEDEAARSATFEQIHDVDRASA